MDKKKGILVVVLGVFLYSLLSIGVKNLYDEWGISDISLVPLFSIFSALITFIYNYFFIKNKSSLILNKNQIFYVFLHGLIGVVFLNVFYFKSLMYLNAGLAIMILYLHSASIFLYKRYIKGIRFHRSKNIALLAIFLGLLLASNSKLAIDTVNYYGVILAFVSSICYAFLHINIEENLEDVQSTVLIMYSQLVAVVVFFIFYGPSTIFNFDVSYSSISYIFILTLLTGLIPMLLVYKGVRILGAYLTSILGTIELPFTAILAFIFLDEKLSLFQMVGMMLIILGAYKIQK
jgi:drug/metabolite transporter (DMT)-like permease